jgi:hypothetical protein
MKNAAVAILIGLCGACSNQTVTGPTSAGIAKPSAAVPASSGVARPPTPSSPAATARDSTRPPAASGIMVLNQFDPPVPIEVDR